MSHEHRTRWWRPLYVLLAFLLTTLVACGGSADPTETTAGVDGADTTAAAEEPSDTEAEEPTEETTGEAASGDYEYVDGVLQPLPDGFPDHELTIVVADDATSSEGILATHVQEVASKYSPVGIDIEIRNDFESYPTWEALRYIAEEPDGQEGYLMMPFATVGRVADTLAADVEGATGQTMDDLQEIIGLEVGRWVITQCADVEWEPTIEALVAESQERPGEIRYMGQGAGGGVDLGFFSVMKALGAGEFDAIPIGGTVEQATATAACEGDVTNTTVEPILPHVQNGRVNMLLVNGDTRIDEFPDVPSALDMGIEDSLVSGRQLTTSAAVPAERVAWLYELFRAMAEDPDYVELREAIPGVEVGAETPEEADQTNQTNVGIIDEVLRDLGLHIEQQ